MIKTAFLLPLLMVPLAVIAAEKSSYDGWVPQSPREEIRPNFEYHSAAGRDAGPSLVIRTDAREGLDGHWAKSFPVTGGKGYRFHALYRATNVKLPRRSVVVDREEHDGRGRLLPAQNGGHFEARHPGH